MDEREKESILMMFDRFDELLDERPCSWDELKRHVALCRVRVQHMENDDGS